MCTVQSTCTIYIQKTCMQCIPKIVREFYISFKQQHCFTCMYNLENLWRINPQQHKYSIQFVLWEFILKLFKQDIERLSSIGLSVQPRTLHNKLTEWEHKLDTKGILMEVRQNVNINLKMIIGTKTSFFLIAHLNRKPNPFIYSM